MQQNMQSATLTIAGKNFIVPGEMIQLLRSIHGWKVDNAEKAYYLKGEKKIFLASEVWSGYNELPPLGPGQRHILRYADNDSNNCMPSNISVSVRKIAERTTVPKSSIKKFGPNSLVDVDQDAPDIMVKTDSRKDRTTALPASPQQPQQVIPIKIELTVSVKVEK